MPNSPWPYKFQANCRILYVYNRGGGGGGGGGVLGGNFYRVVWLCCPRSAELGCLWEAVPWLGFCLICTYFPQVTSTVWFEEDNFETIRRFCDGK